MRELKRESKHFEKKQDDAPFRASILKEIEVLLKFVNEKQEATKAESEKNQDMQQKSSESPERRILNELLSNQKNRDIV
jgi:hypothetical protein